jgi:hypothetical protein
VSVGEYPRRKPGGQCYDLKNIFGEKFGVLGAQNAASLGKK